MSLRRTSTGGPSLSRSTSRTSMAGSTAGEEADLTTCTVAKEINTSKRLEALRNEMKKHDVSVYVIPSEDEHQSEYVSPKDQKRSFISGFSGSAGVAVITRDPLCMNDVPEGLSVLSTDGRYFIQAENELDFNWKLLRQGVEGEPTWEQWALSNAIQMSLDSGLFIKIGINPKLITYSGYLNLSKQLKDKIMEITEKKNLKVSPKVEIVPLKDDLVDAIWGNFEVTPERKASKLLKLDDRYSGESFSSKIQRLRKQLNDQYSNSNIIINSLDEIAWLLNIRGSDIQYNPIFYSFFVTVGDKNIFYCDLKNRLDHSNKDIPDYLKENNIEVKPYLSFYEDIPKISKDVKSFLIPKSANWLIVQSLSSDFKIIDSPVELMKSVKNKTELKNFKTAHSKDGLALIKYFAWLEDQLIRKEEMLNEFDAALKQEEFRKQQKHFVDLSFETISSTGKNAAIIHYSPSAENSALINPDKIYLNDSGAQFLEGTTDVTRTLHFGKPLQEEIDNYTLVLKGNLALELLKFPEGTNGYMIDSIARQHLWSRGLDYKHGTSHGVGSFLNVHEGPIGIGFRPNYAKFKLQAGNVISNEPGYYKSNEYGIRIENVVYVDEAREVILNSDRKFLKLVNLTRVPYCRELINVALLTKDEINHINEYHESIYNEFKEKLKGDAVAYIWLKKQCAPLKNA